MSGDRPVLKEEIEITPEMIDAGVNELLCHDVYPNSAGAGPSLESWREAFRAALYASLQFHLEHRS